MTDFVFEKLIEFRDWVIAFLAFYPSMMKNWLEKNANPNQKLLFCLLHSPTIVALKTPPQVNNHKHKHIS